MSYQKYCIKYSDVRFIQLFIVMVFSILPKKQTKLTILSKEDAQNSEFPMFFGRNEETIDCFRDLPTFRVSSGYRYKTSLYYLASCFWIILNLQRISIQTGVENFFCISKIL